MMTVKKCYGCLESMVQYRLGGNGIVINCKIERKQLKIDSCPFDMKVKSLKPK